MFAERETYRLQRIFTISTNGCDCMVSVNLCSGLLFGSCRSSLVQKCGFKLRHHDVLNVQSFAKSLLGRDFKGEDPGKKPFFLIPCVIKNLKIQMSLCETK